MKKKIISFFKKNSGSSFKSKEIAKKLGYTADHEYQSLKYVLHQLLEEETIFRKGKRFMLNSVPDSNVVTGTLEVTNAGYGFVILKNSKLNDVFISSRNIGTAFHGDTVQVVLFAKKKRKNIEGQIINIVKRKREKFIGTIKKTNSFIILAPDDPKIHRDIYIDKSKLNGAKVGDKVIVGNIVWTSSMLNPEGEVLEKIGKEGLKDTEIASIAREFGLPHSFPENVQREAEEIDPVINDSDIKDRLDYRDVNVFTIDPEDAKDFDDALSVKELENGNIVVGIHIADVSHYVKPKSMLDKEALRRGNSVYLVGKVIPMLPEKLSNGICSLVPGQDRLTYSVIAELTPRGKVVHYEIKKSIINSKRRFTYEEVQDIIENKEGDFYTEIIKLNNLAQTLRKKRVREGSIEFFTTEIKFTLDANDHPVAIVKKEIKQSNMLVEEFMLLANRMVAQHIGFTKQSLPRPFIYRIHDLPDGEKIYEFARFVRSLGYSFNPHSAKQSQQFQQLIQAAKGTEEEALINELAIRSMAKAVYSIHNNGHYGLGFKYYSHFTSPIRRYADLVVHRLLFAYIEERAKVNYPLNILDEICEHVSNCERRAIDAERLSVKLKQIEYLKDHLGEEFHAVISGIMNFGLFVKIIDILAEGLVRLRDLEGDFYVYDERKYALIGRATKRQFRLGDKVLVKLIRVDPEKSELDFIIVD